MADVPDRRRRAALAGHTGDVAGARGLLTDADPAVRATALGALARVGQVAPPELAAALGDPVPAVRRRACEVAIGVAGIDLVPLLDDPDPTVVETAAWALGERVEVDGGADGETVSRLCAVAVGHDDALCREAAVAALGAVGDERGLDAILAATRDRPAVRRRAVIALAPFSGPRVEAALAAALQDRDWQVRQAAEDLAAEDPAAEDLAAEDPAAGATELPLGAHEEDLQ